MEQEKTESREITVRSCSLRSGSANLEARTVDAVLTTDVPTRVFDWSRFEPVDEVLVMDGAIVPDQVPLIESHRSWTLQSLIGSVKPITVGKRAVNGTLRFADDDPDVDKLWNKVRQGHITDVSIGYQVIESTTVLPGEKQIVGDKKYKAGNLPLRVTTSWKILEASLVPIGADDQAKIRRSAGFDGATAVNVPVAVFVQDTNPYGVMDEDAENPVILRLKSAREMFDMSTGPLTDPAREACADRKS